MVAYLKSLFREAKKSDLLSHAAYLDRLMSDLAAARVDRNWTATASLQRLVGQCIGSLSDHLVIEDPRLTDEQLLERVGAVDPVLRERLERLLGAKATFH